MELKPGYKQSEVGIIPAEWEIATLGATATLSSGTTPPRALADRYYRGGNIAWVKTLDLNNSFIVSTEEHVTQAALAETSLRCYPPGSVLVAMYGGFNQIGRTGLLRIKAAVNQALTAIRPNRDQLRSEYLLNVLNARVSYWKVVASSSRKDPNITSRDIRDFQIALPCLKEQEAISEALSDADALIESLEQLLVKKRQVKQGAMQELLTGKKRLPGFIGKWEEKRVGEFTDCTAGGTPSTMVPEYWGGAIPWMNSGELNLKIVDDVEGRITEKGLQWSSTKVIPAHCVLIGLAGQGKTRGTVAMNRIPLCTNQSIAAILPAQSFSPRYLYFNLDSRYEELRELSAGDGGRGGLNLTIIRSLIVPFPLIEEQEAISAVLSDMDAEIGTLEARLTKARQIKQGMMQELLTGRIRLVRPSAQVLSFPAKESASVAKASHNAQINEAVVIAVLSAKFGSETFPLGRFRRTKFAYLLHRHVEREAAGFMKKAAGPYNPSTRYGGAEKIALQNQYVRVVHAEKGEGFVAGEKITQAEGYFEKWYGAEALNWLEQFRYQKKDALELLTTVDMACEDLSRVGKAITFSAVKQIIHDSPEWKAKLNRSVFSDDNIAKTIQTCGQLFPPEEE